MVYIEDIEQPHYHNRRKPSIKEACPEVAGEWFYERNCGWRPEDFSTGSNVHAWWQCGRNPEHIWQRRIVSRCELKTNCPFCIRKRRTARVIREGSLAFYCPEVVDEWHITKNGSRTPQNVLVGSRKKAWWQCRKNGSHVWEALIKSRVYGAGCPDCYDGKNLDLSKCQDTLTLYDKKKNRFDLRYITMHDDIWWRCSQGPDHSWQGKFIKNLSCPFCRNKKVSLTNSLKTLYPKVAKQLHPTRNGEITADTITAYSSLKVWWRCPLNPHHIWETTVNNRTRNESRCPEC